MIGRRLSRYYNCMVIKVWLIGFLGEDFVRGGSITQITNWLDEFC